MMQNYGLKKMGFQKTIDPCVYVRENTKGEKFIICHYVDDLILVNKDENELSQVKSDLSGNFEVKDLGKLNYYLGVEFKRQEDGCLWMGQESYTKQIPDLVWKIAHPLILLFVIVKNSFQEMKKVRGLTLLSISLQLEVFYI